VKKLEGIRKKNLILLKGEYCINLVKDLQIVVKELKEDLYKSK